MLCEIQRDIVWRLVASHPFALNHSMHRSAEIQPCLSGIFHITSAISVFLTLPIPNIFLLSPRSLGGSLPFSVPPTLILSSLAQSLALSFLSLLFFHSRPPSLSLLFKILVCSRVENTCHEQENLDEELQREIVHRVMRDEVTKLKEDSKNVSKAGLDKMDSFVQGVSTTMTEVGILKSQLFIPFTVQNV